MDAQKYFSAQHNNCCGADAMFDELKNQTIRKLEFRVEQKNKENNRLGSQMKELEQEIIDISKNLYAQSSKKGLDAMFDELKD